MMLQKADVTVVQCGLMSNLEHRKALPEVLDRIHKQTVVRTLVRLGLDVTVDTPWKAIQDLDDGTNYEGEFILSNVAYRGMYNVGTLAGMTPNYLMASGATEVTSSHHMAADEELYISPRNRMIELRSAIGTVAQTMLFLHPDTPPYALRASDIKLVRALDPSLRDTKDEHALAHAIRDSLGEAAVHFIDEPTAETLINALQREQTWIPVML